MKKFSLNFIDFMIQLCIIRKWVSRNHSHMDIVHLYSQMIINTISKKRGIK